ncbi:MULTISPECIES: hypothetical protein [Deinococcus]|uniref:MarR family transcriptional regulator n=1 Tax=Deinococcus rufus TaxID=2136097 RepID=A0ABV7ZC05_9DEIO|nr:hypothetical protein [Deinococcus sp. AB2017081]WQE97339.1 hypothetical protein U2P90_19735 [Deinococcus sp. AB2017081]
MRRSAVLSTAQTHLLRWIREGSLVERTDVTGVGEHVELFMGGTAVEQGDIDVLEAQGLIEALSMWTIHDYGYVRYGLTAFGLAVLQTSEQDHLE